MQETEQKTYTLSSHDYKQSIEDGSDFYLQFKMMNHDIDVLINKIIHRYLGQYDILFIKDTALNIIKELINNAIKANLKRLYFKSRKLDINKIEDYRLGMETFKQETFMNKNFDLTDTLQQSNLVVRLAFKVNENNIYFNIINNIPIMEAELQKIDSRIKKAYKYTDISDAFNDVLDDSEGAGLGLIMAMMVLKNCGLPASNFSIYRKGELTIAKLKIPQRFTKPEKAARVTEEIIREIENIPALPENIRNIQRLCQNPDSTIRQIADSIARDPGLTTSIFKLANSAGYITSKKITRIDDAVKIIGIKGVNTLLIASGVQKVFEEKYKKYESIWKTSYKRAYYAHKISIQLRKTKISEFAYLGGLLADIGKIIMLSINPIQLDHLKEMLKHKGMQTTPLLEEISLGISHSSIGGLVCEKWKFNKSLTSAISFHDRPHLAPDNIKQLVYIIYLADMYVRLENNKIHYELIDEDVLTFFNLTNKEPFELLHKILKETYSMQLDTL